MGPLPQGHVGKKTNTHILHRQTDRDEPAGGKESQYGGQGTWAVRGLEKKGGGSPDRGGINPNYLIVHGTLVRAGING